MNWKSVRAVVAGVVAIILGVVGVALGLVGVVATWNLGLGPRWYPIALVVLAIPQCWAGGKIHDMQAGR